MFGISAALTTPFTPDGSVDFARLNTHIKTVLAEGCSSVTFFGTTGEGPSVASDTRLEAVRAANDAGIDPGKFVLTLHGAAASDVVHQARAALEIGVRRFLIPPPCYFNDPEYAGLIKWFTQVLSQFTGTGAQFILYHIPQVIGVGLAIDLVADLKAAFPKLVLGVKDSSGSFENTCKLLQLNDLEILVGDERQLAACAGIGASGSICGIANVFAARMAQVLASGVDDKAINHLVDTVLMYSVTPAIKSLVAHKYASDDWRRTCPPLIATSDSGFAALAKAYDAVGTSA